ncbi:PREDICTED: uncharacterized protein LOC108764909 [Trachymyrmex cornetzi]|uniref:Gem-associated protein 8 n=1 Tax=Trachymyrmex cornetzi TaxID=471704 RepID=A0A151J188_9HYME|nr:PREDICTED: uncharacterized protein LOC108764909 [Trachymyrmex cornetzi]KYN15546.1 hypothetical protein ALC57_12247 [Trachymyrmex cornetzi]
MELTECAIGAIAKRRKKWKRKRRLKRLKKKRLREREVRFNVSHWTAFSEYVTDVRETLATGTMQADAFWKNYAVTQEWQKRHNITWWRSRCVALERENKLLRDKVRSLAQSRGYRDTRENYNYYVDNDNDDAEEDNDTQSDTNEDLEFNVTEDLLKFFETSERHKREMRLKRECSETEDEEENLEEESFVGAAESTQVKKDEADLLQGDADSKILVMETTSQSTIEDTAN